MDVLDLPEPPEVVCCVVSPAVTKKVVGECAELGVRFVWMQPGAESVAAIENGLKNGLNVFADGTCVLVVLGFQDH